MQTVIEFSPEEAMPDRAAVLHAQGVPRERATGPIKRICDDALALLAEHITPIGIHQAVSAAAFAEVCHGEGRNDPHSPIPRALGSEGVYNHPSRRDPVRNPFATRTPQCTARKSRAAQLGSNADFLPCPLRAIAFFQRRVCVDSAAAAPRPSHAPCAPHVALCQHPKPRAGRWPGPIARGHYT